MNKSKKGNMNISCMRERIKFTNVVHDIRPQLYVRAKITDKDGKSYEVLNKKSESFLKNWAALLYHAMGFNCRLPEMRARSLSTPGYKTRGWGRLNNNKLDLKVLLANAHDLAECGLTVGINNTKPVYWEQAGLHSASGIPEKWDRTTILHGNGSGQLVYGVHLPILPIVTSDNAFFGIARTMTNNSGANIDVKETGIYYRYPLNLYSYPIPSASTTWLNSWSPDCTFLVARDALAPENVITVPNGSVLTLEYRFGINFDTVNGGLTRQFIDLLYRHCLMEQHTVFNLNGNGVDKSPSKYGMLCQATLGNRIYTDSTDVHHTNDMGLAERLRREFLGVIVGVTDTNMLISNTFLMNKINEENGLLHYGSKVWNYQEEPESLKAQFDIENMFLNKSGATLNIKEAGLTCMGDENNLHLIARNKIAPAVSVPHGDGLRVIYRMKIEDV